MKKIATVIRTTVMAAGVCQAASARIIESISKEFPNLKDKE